MKQLIDIIKQKNLLNLEQSELNKLKYSKDPYIINEDAKLYKNSLYKKDGLLYCIGKIKYDKNLFVFSNTNFKTEFKEKVVEDSGIFYQKVELKPENAVILKKLFPFTAPISLREKKTTIGCGDRLGRATPGHLRAARNYDIYPVLAQQSIRELNFTKRTYDQVTSDAAFLVFQEGFERGYGADGDHLKTIADIDVALKAGMPMITLDLSEVMNAKAANWDYKDIEKEFEKLDSATKKRLLESYANKNFKIGKTEIKITEEETKRCAVIYNSALDFAKVVDDHLRKNRGDKYDLEISIDETTTPTLPEHHLYIIKELNYRKVTVNSLAPRFIGEFQKAIDYIGNKKEFEKQYIIHCDIAKANGNYKVSIHSGSDKFAVFPIIGKHTNLRLHLKTAGTSWLEAVRCISMCAPNFYRKIHKKAFHYFPEASKFYHITADLTKIPDIDKIKDKDLPKFLMQNESRQLLHITYGGLLNDPEIRDEFFNILSDNEELYYQLLFKHFTKHIEKLGVKKIK